MANLSAQIENESLIEALRDEAKDEGRSLSKQLEQVLKDRYPDVVKKKK